ncbi:hypothetical protein NMY22_g17683 [Coprinellus aureogranulatus]|nr:hypothetical protein NMY22_g17683 [Coprinellus aureogranulatus]
MAFPVPSHLPRKPAVEDVTSKILTSIDQATFQSINSALATSWVAELDESIRSTKGRIHSRIQEDLPLFKRQLETSKSVQARLQHISKEVDVLNDVISNPQTGIVPKVLDTLKKHAALAQETSDASVEAESLEHLLKCKQHHASVMSLVQFGKLPEAVAAAMTMEELIASAPTALERATIMKDLKRKSQTLKTNLEGQLLECLSRSVVATPSSFTIHPRVPVRDTEATINLDEIFASLSPSALNDYLTTLRRDFMAHYSHSLNLTPAPSQNTEQRKQLEGLFAQTTHPPAERKREIALELGLTPRQVHVWFQNRRAKARSANTQQERATHRQALDTPRGNQQVVLFCRDSRDRDDAYNALINEANPDIVLPCDSITVGSWIQRRRLDTKDTLPMAYVCCAEQELSLLVEESGNAFKITIPFDIIVNVDLEGSPQPASLPSRVEQHRSEAMGIEGHGSATTPAPLERATALIHLARPPLFYFLASSTLKIWQACDDWTEHQQGTLVPFYRLHGEMLALETFVRFLSAQPPNFDQLGFIRRIEEWGITGTHPAEYAHHSGWAPVNPLAPSPSHNFVNKPPTVFNPARQGMLRDAFLTFTTATSPSESSLQLWLAPPDQPLLQSVEEEGMLAQSKLLHPQPGVLLQRQPTAREPCLPNQYQYHDESGLHMQSGASWNASLDPGSAITTLSSSSSNARRCHTLELVAELQDAQSMASRVLDRRSSGDTFCGTEVHGNATLFASSCLDSVMPNTVRTAQYPAQVASTSAMVSELSQTKMRESSYPMLEQSCPCAESFCVQPVFCSSLWRSPRSMYSPSLDVALECRALLRVAHTHRIAMHGLNIGRLQRAYSDRVLSPLGSIHLGLTGSAARGAVDPRYLYAAITAFPVLARPALTLHFHELARHHTAHNVGWTRAHRHSCDKEYQALSKLYHPDLPGKRQGALSAPYNPVAEPDTTDLTTAGREEESARGTHSQQYQEIATSSSHLEDEDVEMQDVECYEDDSESGEASATGTKHASDKGDIPNDEDGDEDEDHEDDDGPMNPASGTQVTQHATYPRQLLVMAKQPQRRFPGAIDGLVRM